MLFTHFNEKDTNESTATITQRFRRAKFLLSTATATRTQQCRRDRNTRSQPNQQFKVSTAASIKT